MPAQDDKLRVLVVDDDVDAATSLCALLHHSDCEAQAACGMAIALAVAASFGPHVVVLDLEMPDSDGCHLLQEMRERGDGLADPLYVCLTGASSDENRRRCEAAGFHRFHAKPLRPHELAEILADGRARRLRQRIAMALSRAAPLSAAGAAISRIVRAAPADDDSLSH
jgi:CheY-like chemotaxis protein